MFCSKMENFQEIKQFIELTLAGRDDNQDYETILAVVTTLCYTMLEKFRHSIILHRRLLNNLTIYCYEQRRKKLETAVQSNCKCKICSVLNLVENGTEAKNHIRISLIVFHKLHELMKHDNVSVYSLLTLLIWLAKGCNSDEILNYCHHKNPSAINKIIDNTLNAVLKLSSTLIKLPQEEREIQNIGINFAGMAGHTAFASIVGAIGTWEIKINDEYQINKEYRVTNMASANSDEIFLEIVPSMLYFQVVCNHHGLILDMHLDFSRNTSNAEILRQSSIYREKRYPPFDYFIIGNKNFPCISRPISILTPYPLPMNSAREAQFNSYHARLIGVTEKVFNQIYCRWRELFEFPLNLSEFLSPRIVQACAIIHNLCLLFEDNEPSSANTGACFSNYENLKEAPDYEENEVDSEDVRDFIARQLPIPMIVPFSYKPKCLTNT